MFKRYLAAASAAILLFLGSAQAAQLTQQHTWTSGDEVKSIWLNGDIQQLITESNSQDTRLNTIEAGYSATILQVLKGGTGASTAAGARTNLGAAASGANSDITSITGLTTPLAVTQGGLGLTSIAAGRLLYSSSSNAFAPLTLGSALSITSDTLNVNDNTTTQKVQVYNNGTLVGTRKAVNLIPGTNVSLTVTDNSGSDRVDVTINSTLSTQPGVTLLSTATASASSSIDFTSNINSTYDAYMLVISDMVMGTNQAMPFIRVTEDGSTWVNSASSYSYANDGTNGSGAGNNGSTTGTEMRMSLDASSAQKFVNTEPISGTIWFYAPSNTSRRKIFNWTISGLNGNGATSLNGMGLYKATTNAITGVRIIMDTGTISSGNFYLYGFKKTP